MFPSTQGTPKGKTKDAAALGPRVTRWMKLLFLGNLLGTLGIFLELSGGSWDVATHILRGGRGTDDFWTAPHAVLYAGVALLGLGSLSSVPLTFVGSFRAPGHLTLGLKMALGGSLLQAFAGAFDQWWHATRGPDVVLLSPPHATLIVAMALNAFAMVLSTTRLQGALGGGNMWKRFPWPRALQFLSLTALWMALNAQVYLFTDFNGIRYTFGVDLEPYAATVTLAAILVLATLGTLLLFLAELLAGVWAPSRLALFMAPTMAVSTMIPLGRLSFIPAYLALVVPVAFLDYLATRRPGGLPQALRAVALAPFAFALDGWYSFFVLPAIAQDPVGALTAALVLTLAVGLLGLRFSRGLGRILEGLPSPTSP